jgi:hypothetical protein
LLAVIEERPSVAKLIVRYSFYGCVIGAAYLLYDAITGDDAPAWQWIGSIAVLVVLVPLIVGAWRFRRLDPEERQARLEAMNARVASTSGEVARYKRIHDSSKSKDAVLRDGVEGTAIIVAISDGGRASEFRSLVGLELEVHLPARSPYVVETGEWATAASTGSIEPGRELVVKVDRNDPDRVAVDWDASLRLR